MDPLANLQFTTSGALIELVDSQLHPLSALRSFTTSLGSAKRSLIRSRSFAPHLSLRSRVEQRRSWCISATTAN